MLYSDGLKAIHIADETAQLVNNRLSEAHREAMKKNADACNYFQLSTQNQTRKSCLYCAYLDTQIYSCEKLNKLVIPYRWI